MVDDRVIDVNARHIATISMHELLLDLEDRASALVIQAAARRFHKIGASSPLPAGREDPGLGPGPQPLGVADWHARGSPDSSSKRTVSLPTRAQCPCGQEPQCPSPPRP